jgi:solute carrier family 8 (sodium/calcium exchanger)
LTGNKDREGEEYGNSESNSGALDAYREIQGLRGASEALPFGPPMTEWIRPPTEKPWASWFLQRARRLTKLGADGYWEKQYYGTSAGIFSASAFESGKGGYEDGKAYTDREALEKDCYENAKCCGYVWPASGSSLTHGYAVISGCFEDLQGSLEPLLRTGTRRAACGSSATKYSVANQPDSAATKCNVWENGVESTVTNQAVNAASNDHLFTVHAYKRLICDPGGEPGYFFPLFGESENTWSKGFRGPLYFFGLLWLFAGVAIISDVFMGAIVVITSAEKQVMIGESTFHVRTWNDTVANLTLMALGSSAPEIMLSVVEIYGRGWKAGDLGPSTIVGSAAFNMLVISGVCVSAIGVGDSRKVADIGVFALTATFSIFAYVWLIIILMFSSPDVVTTGEAVLTFLFCPVLVVGAWVVDTGIMDRCLSRGKFRKNGKVAPNGNNVRVRQISSDRVRTKSKGDMDHKMLTDILKQIRAERPDIAADELSHEAALRALKQGKRSRAYYRVQATRMLTAGAQVGVSTAQIRRTMTKIDMALTKEAKESKLPYGAFENKQKKEAEEVTYDDSRNLVSLKHRCMSVFEDAKKLAVKVRRYGKETETSTLRVDFETQDGSANAGEDYVARKGSLTFGPGEREKVIEIELIEDMRYEEDETFSVVLSNASLEGAPGSPKAGARAPCEMGEAKCVVTIINVDFPGVFVFQSQHYRVCESEKMIEIIVKRIEGCSGRVSCDYRTKDVTAIAGADYEAVEGTLVFEQGETEKTVKIPIVDDNAYEKDETFRLELINATGQATFAATTDGGEEMEICVVTIISDEATVHFVDHIFTLMHMNRDRIKLGTGNWSEQFKQAVYVHGGDEDAETSIGDYATHVTMLFWKVLFALVPPTDFLGGWASFVCSLCMIAIVTIWIGDLASMLGCVFGMPDAVTAITLVALGTSLPDTFASMTAALQDDTADASLGNVTGSNSVNVFLGLGLPWLLAALHWDSEGASAEWLEYVHKLDPMVVQGLSDNGVLATGGFVVPAGGLGFSVIVYSVCACACIATLMLRRRAFGAELGGPDPWRHVTSAFFIFLWAIYILLSTLKQYNEI